MTVGCGSTTVSKPVTTKPVVIEKKVAIIPKKLVSKDCDRLIKLRSKNGTDVVDGYLDTLEKYTKCASSAEAQKLVLDMLAERQVLLEYYEQAKTEATPVNGHNRR